MVGLSFMLTIATAGVALASMSLLNRRERVVIAEAGATGSIVNRPKDKNFVHMRPIVLKNNEGKVIDKTNLIRVLVDGKCMEKKGIMDGSQLYAEKYISSAKFSKQVEQGDVLLIYLQDKNIYKLRIFDKKEDGKLFTYRYDIETGERRNSSKPHTINSVVGVVKYIL